MGVVLQEAQVIRNRLLEEISDEVKPPYAATETCRTVFPPGTLFLLLARVENHDYFHLAERQELLHQEGKRDAEM
jgi:hypothetical protein